MAHRIKNPFEDKEEHNFEDISTSPELRSIRAEQDYYKQKMIDSSHRSVRMIQESQDIASETAETLHKQREQLERTNRNLDKMQDDLKESDRSITSLKSIWGTMSNWFRKPVTKSSTDHSNEKASKTVSQLKKENEELKKEVVRANKATNLAWEGGYQSQEQNPVNDIVDQNLDQMLSGLAILKQQGLSLGKEIDEHSEIIVDIQGKVDKTDIVIESQNKRIDKILR